MKDKEARIHIDDLNEYTEILARRIGDLESAGICIKDCPKCQHPVLAQKIPDTSYNTITYIAPDSVISGSWYNHKPEHTFQCLACGTKFTCSEKCVCEIIKEER